MRIAWCYILLNPTAVSLLAIYFNNKIKIKYGTAMIEDGRLGAVNCGLF